MSNFNFDSNLQSTSLQYFEGRWPYVPPLLATARKHQCHIKYPDAGTHISLHITGVMLCEECCPLCSKSWLLRALQSLVKAKRDDYAR